MKKNQYDTGRLLMKNSQSISNAGECRRKPLLTIKVGALTRWVRDLLAIILMWKMISIVW